MRWTWCQLDELDGNLLLKRIEDMCSSAMIADLIAKSKCMGQ